MLELLRQDLPSFKSVCLEIVPHSVYQSLHFDALKKYNDFKAQLSKPFGDQLNMLFQAFQGVKEKEGFQENFKVEKLVLEPFKGEDEEALYDSIL